VDHDAGHGAGPEVGATQHEDAGRHGGFGDNGLGNGLDAPPPGSPPPNPNADTAFDAQGDFAKGGAGHEVPNAQDEAGREGEPSGREEHPVQADEPKGAAAGQVDSGHAEVDGKPSGHADDVGKGDESGHADHGAGPGDSGQHGHEPQGQALGHDKVDHDAGHGAGPEVGAAQHEDAGRHGGFGDNGLGNGLDAPPPGSPPPNPNADTAFDAQGDFAKGGAGHEGSGAQDKVDREDESSGREEHPVQADEPKGAAAGHVESGHAEVDGKPSDHADDAGKGGGAGSWTDITQADTNAPATSPAAHGDWTASVEHEPPKTSHGQGKSGAGLDAAPAPSHAVEAFEQSAQDHHKGHDM